MYCNVELLDGYEASIGFLYGGFHALCPLPTLYSTPPGQTFETYNFLSYFDTPQGSSMGDRNVGFKRYLFGYVPKEGNRVAQLLAKEGLRRDESTYLSGAVSDFAKNEVEKDR
ncbi:hypothetical protein Gotur_014368 [Gossypium turneri]